MKRREFIAGISAATWPFAARAQQSGRVRQIGILTPGDENSSGAKVYFPLFTRRLEELGWVNGRNVHIELRFAGGNVDRMRTLARELSDLRPDVIVVSSSAATKAVQEQTRDIPIVFVYAGDPVASGILTNIARPEGNITGVTGFPPSVGGKWPQLLKEAKPSLATVALVYNPEFLNAAELAAIEEAAVRSGVKAARIVVREASEIPRALDAFATEPDGGVIPVPVLALPRAYEFINQAALRHRLPTIYNDRSGAADGGLMSYGVDAADLFRRGAPDYVDRILRGAKPSELPVQFSTKFELIVNLKTAKAIGVTIPEAFLAQADEVIE
jgi:putative ABC transport system substrate-binding protein